MKFYIWYYVVQGSYFVHLNDFILILFHFKIFHFKNSSLSSVMPDIFFLWVLLELNLVILFEKNVKKKFEFNKNNV